MISDGRGVTWRPVDGVLVVGIDNLPANTLSARVRARLCDALDAAEGDEDIAAVLLIGVGRHFSAGADIHEFGQTPQPLLLGDVCHRIEACIKPVVASVQGVAYGGGLEVALAAHYRVAEAGAKFGFPEVKLGLLPGAGGTQRAPRLVGVKAALEMMLTGQPIDARRACDIGLIDRIGTHHDSLLNGLDYAHELIASGDGPRRTRDSRRALHDANRNRDEIAAAEARLGQDRKLRGLYSPRKIVDLVAAVLDHSFEDGLGLEREAFRQCLATPQRAALVHVFFAEQKAASVPEAKRARPRQFTRTGVVGGGTMGAGIAVAMLDAGLRVMMIEHDDAKLAQGRARVQSVYDTLMSKGRLGSAGKDERLANLFGATSYDALADADLVVEAVFEDLPVKIAVFAELDRVCKAGAVLASNTSYLDLNVIAATTSRPRDVIGLHFFSPANIMKLVEVVVPRQAADDVVATGFALAKHLRKVPVRAGVCDGFIGNRMLSVYRRAAEYMLMDGASPYQIDRVVREFGFPMGPFQMSDLAGGDIAWAARKRREVTRDPDVRYVRIADRLCERSWFGQKTGRGWYLYPNGARAGQEDPEVMGIVDQERRSAGVTPRSFGDKEITRRFLAAMINEGANVVHQQIALRPLDVDVVLINGYGFPRYCGGPMHYADQVGLDNVLADLRELEFEDARFWKPSPLLVERVGRGGSFEELNQT